MKKALILLMFFVTFNITTSANKIDKIKIGLFYNSTAKDSITITADDVPTTYIANDVSEDIIITSERPVKVEGKQYRGSIILKKDENGKLTVINEVDIEDYVASVIAKEMSPSFNMEALKAQAVCARTYAFFNIGKHKKHGFDLCITQDCQVYDGVSAEHENTIKAANETKGQMLAYNGAPIETVYFATSGGYTESAKNVWGSDLPYLQGVEDEYEKSSVYAYTWEKELSPQKATEVLNSKGYNIGNVKSIDVLEKSETGSVTKLKVTGDSGEKIFTKESCRTIFNMLSQAYEITPPKTGKVLYAHNGVVKTTDINVLSANNAVTLNKSVLYLQGSTLKKADISPSKDVYVFKGRGNGHLVGMSQNGANGMAQDGFSYIEILQHYYKGTEII